MLITPNHLVFGVNVLKRILRVLFILSGLSTPLANAVEEEPEFEFPPKMVISYINHNAVINLYKPLIERAYQSLGIKVFFTTTSTARAQDLLDRKLLDADVIRGELFIKENLDAMYVGPRLARANINLICSPSLDCTPTGIKNKRIGVLGTLERYRDVMSQSAAELVRANDQSTLLKLYRLNRVDFIIDIEVIDSPFNSVIDAPHNKRLLQTVDAYHVIHKRFAHLAPQISAALEKSQQYFLRQEQGNQQINPDDEG